MYLVAAMGYVIHISGGTEVVGYVSCTFQVAAVRYVHI